MVILEDKVWAGTEASLHAMLKAEENQPDIKAWQEDDEDEDETPRLLTVKDGIGFIEVKGPLVNSDSWINEYLGRTGYPEIREAMVAAANDPEVKEIFLDINSGGGSVNGLWDTAQLVRTINDRVKNVTAYTDGSMFSAAYAIGSAAGKVYASKAAGVGSVGVIATHMSYAEALKKDGVEANVIRAGKNKALASSVEPLSEAGRAQIQAAVDAAYSVFIDHVVEMRGKSENYVRTVMADGNEFYGQAAADASLVDAITTYDALLSSLNDKIVAESINSPYTAPAQSNRLNLNGGASTMALSKKPLTEQNIAALAAGASVAIEANTEAETDETELVGAVDTAADKDAGTEDKVEAKSEDKPSSPVGVSAEIHDYTVKQLAASQADLLATRLELSKLQDKHDEVTAVVDPLKAIAAKATNNMRIALGGSALNMDSVSAAQVLADHTAVSADFAKKFKVGGVSAPSAQAEAASKDSAKTEFKMDSAFAARINAVRGKEVK